MAKESSPISISITPASIITAAAVILGIWLLFFLKDLVLIVLTAVVISSAIEPAVLWFMRLKFIIRPVAVSLVYIIVLGVLFGVAYLFFPPLIDELSGFIGTLPGYLDTFNVNQIINNNLISTTQQVVSGNNSIVGTLTELQNIFTSTGGGAFRALSGIFGGVFSFLMILLLSFFFALQETGIDDFLRIITPATHEKYVVGLWRRTQRKIGLWMQGQLLLSLIVAVLTYLWLTILGVPFALLLAIFAAIAELVPVFGSVVAAVPSIAVAFSVGGMPLALLAAGGYLVINQLQGNLIYPLVAKKIVGVPPLLVILALIAGAQLAGFLGVLLSVPIAASIRELIADFEARKRGQTTEGV